MVRPRLGFLPEEVPESERWPVETLNAFLAELARFGNVTAAARELGLSRTRLYHLRERDPDFARAWSVAEAYGVRGLLDEAVRRATVGTVKPIYWQGERVFEPVLDPETGQPITDSVTGERRFQPAGIREYSDGLLQTLLKAKLPEFRERVEVDHSGKLETAPALDLSRLSTEELRTFVALSEKARPLAAIDVPAVESGAPAAEDPSDPPDDSPEPA